MSRGICWNSASLVGEESPCRQERLYPFALKQLHSLPTQADEHTRVIAIKHRRTGQKTSRMHDFAETPSLQIS